MTLQTPEFLQTKTYNALRLRNAVFNQSPDGEGVISPGGLKVSQRAAGANMSVDVAEGAAMVRGDDAARQGLYHQYNDATLNVAIGAAHATLPRVDRVVLQNNDSTVIGVTDVPTITVVAGTPTAAATLDNLNGVAAIPNSALLLADVLVAATVTTILAADIRDRRASPSCALGPLAQLQTLYKAAVQAELVNQLAGSVAYGSVPANGQHTSRIKIPRRITGANRLQIVHMNVNATPTGNFNLGIYDHSGRKIMETGAVAISGAANQTIVETITIASLDLDAGFYHTVLGVASGATNVPNWDAQAILPSRAPERLAGVLTTGGTTLPTVISTNWDALGVITAGVPDQKIVAGWNISLAVA